MQIGVADYGMNVWYGGLYDIEERLVALRELGLHGTERLEAVSPSDALEKAAIYRRLGMEFSTCRGPSTQVGIQWTAALDKDYVWLTPNGNNRETDFSVFCRRCAAMIDACARYGVRAGIHNHMGQRVQTQEELEEFLVACPEAGIVFDTGHLSMAGGDPVKLVERHADRICVVHVKDVFLTGATRADGTPEYRFCELGAGNNGFSNRDVIDALLDVGYDGWVHIEHDTHLRDPLEDLAVSLKFLRDSGIESRDD